MFRRIRYFLSDLGFSTYLLQAGAFRGAEDADAMKLRLALMGLEAQIVTADDSVKLTAAFGS